MTTSWHGRFGTFFERAERSTMQAEKQLFWPQRHGDVSKNHLLCQAVAACCIGTFTKCVNDGVVDKPCHVIFKLCQAIASLNGHSFDRLADGDGLKTHRKRLRADLGKFQQFYYGETQEVLSRPIEFFCCCCCCCCCCCPSSNRHEEESKRSSLRLFTSSLTLCCGCY